MTADAPTGAGFETPALGGSPLGPVQAEERLVALDLLRGVALFGILMVNMQFFALPLGVALGEGVADLPARDQAAWHIVKSLFESKFIGIFSLLFGAGLMLQHLRAEARGRPLTGLYMRRLAVLLVLGLIHGLLFWYGDILFAYSIIGLIVFWFRRAKARTHIVVWAILFGVGFVQLATCTGLQSWQLSMVQFPEVAEEGLRGFEAMKAAQFNQMHPVFIEAETAAYAEGPYGDLVAFRTFAWATAQIFMLLIGFFTWPLAMFFLGMGLMKSGFFSGESRITAGRVGVFGLVIGLPLEAVAGYLMHRGGYAPQEMPMLFGSILHFLAVPFVCLGYIGLLTKLALSGALAPVVAFIGRGGRMALTVYLGETLIVTTLMYFYGFGKFGSYSRLELIGIAVAVWLGLTVAANLWLTVFRMGPLEWAWRCVTYGRLVPIRR